MYDHIFSFFCTLANARQTPKISDKSNIWARKIEGKWRPRAGIRNSGWRAAASGLKPLPRRAPKRSAAAHPGNIYQYTTLVCTIFSIQTIICSMYHPTFSRKCGIPHFDDVLFGCAPRRRKPPERLTMEQEGVQGGTEICCTHLAGNFGVVPRHHFVLKYVYIILAGAAD